MQRAASLGHVAINWQLNSNWPQLLLLLFSDGLLFRLLLLLLLLLFAAFGNCFWHVYHLGLSFDWALAADKHLFIYYVQLGHIKHESVCLPMRFTFAWLPFGGMRGQAQQHSCRYRYIYICWAG